MIMNLGLYGYQIKFPFFMGTSSESEDNTKMTSGLGITLGVVAVANLVAFLVFKQYKKYFKSKKYTKLDVDFRKFQDKISELQDKERENMNRLGREPEQINRKAFINLLFSNFGNH
jgi:hypothetical protein